MSLSDDINETAFSNILLNNFSLSNPIWTTLCGPKAATDKSSNKSNKKGVSAIGKCIDEFQKAAYKGLKSNLKVGI